MIRSMTETGLIDFWIKEAIPKASYRYKSRPMSQRERNPLGWEHLKGAFYILLVGYTLSLWVFSVEYWSTHLHKIKAILSMR